MICHTLETPYGFPVYYSGPSVHQGPLPAFFYFSLSGEESLTLSPYNMPVEFLQDAPLRVFSLTLPFHGDGFDKFHAMEEWLTALDAGENFLDPFLDSTKKAIEWLIEESIVDSSSMAVGGLSRGGFIAAHVAANDTRIKTLLGFAPLTRLQELQKSDSFEKERLERIVEPLNLTSLIPSLLHIHHFRFYIGNNDTCVGTDACYQFIRKYTLKAHETRARDCKIELFITPSIGHKGHGTSSSNFQEGSLWIKKHLLKE